MCQSCLLVYLPKSLSISESRLLAWRPLGEAIYRAWIRPYGSSPGVQKREIWHTLNSLIRLWVSKWERIKWYLLLLAVGDFVICRLSSCLWRAPFMFGLTFFNFVLSTVGFGLVILVTCPVLLRFCQTHKETHRNAGTYETHHGTVEFSLFCFVFCSCTSFVS